MASFQVSLKRRLSFSCPLLLLYSIFLCNFALMIICNTTYHVECSISGEFIDWIKQEFLPRATEKGLVSHPRLMRLMGHNEGGACFALQLQADSLRLLQQWNQEVGKALHQAIIDRFGDKVAGFTTFMENIDI